MKVFKMFHLNILDGSIVREIGALHRVVQGGAVFEHNSHECNLGNDDTTNEQFGEKTILKLTKHFKSNIDGDIINVINKVFLDFRATNLEFPPLKLHLLSALRILRGKHKNVLVWGIARLAHPNTITFLSYVIGDSALKSTNKLLESLASKNNHLKDRTTRHKRI
jgi:hypothetical protein